MLIIDTSAPKRRQMSNFGSFDVFGIASVEISRITMTKLVFKSWLYQRCRVKSLLYKYDPIQFSYFRKDKKKKTNLIGPAPVIGCFVSLFVVDLTRETISEYL